MHAGVRDDNYGDCYKSGDIIGCYISLNEYNPEHNLIKFFKNKIDQGIAFSGKDITPGIYFPAISLYEEVEYTYIVSYTFSCILFVSHIHNCTLY